MKNLRIKIDKNYSENRFTVSMMDSNQVLLSVECGKSPLEVLNKISNRRIASRSPEIRALLQNFENLILLTPKDLWVNECGGIYEYKG